MKGRTMIEEGNKWWGRTCFARRRGSQFAWRMWRCDKILVLSGTVTTSR